MTVRKVASSTQPLNLPAHCAAEQGLLLLNSVTTMRFLRYRVLAVIAIGVITSALSLIAVVRVLSVTTQQRNERGREAVRQEVDYLAAAGPEGMRQVLLRPPALATIGMRGGFWDGQSALGSAGPRTFDSLSQDWRQAVSEVLQKSAAERTQVTLERTTDAGSLVFCAQPTQPQGAGIVWAGMLVPLPHYWHFWLTIVTLLAAATALLVSIAIWAVISFNRSVAEQERLARELFEQERLSGLGRVVAGVAHEVRNPLASIKLRLDLAAASAVLPPSVESAIGHATAEIARLDRLVTDLLFVSGRQIGPRIRSGVGALVRTRAEALLPWAAARGVGIRVHGDAAAMIDAESVARAIDNLLRNAVEAAPAGSEVQVYIEEAADTLLVRIEDHGPGVPRSSELFEPFFTTKSDGTGLGLAISRAIARSHGGDVTYTRIEPITRFELSLRLGAQSLTAAKFGA